MDYKQSRTILKKIDEVTATHKAQEIKDLQLEKAKRITQHLDSLASTCSECREYLDELKDRSVQLALADSLSSKTILSYREFVQKISAHLREKHGMVQEGTGMSIGIAIGLAAGVALGLSVFKNLAVGIAIGMAIGVSIGAAKDAKAKKEGKLI